jgi:branched-chain amino acid transport system substrate-binding protein
MTGSNTHIHRRTLLKGAAASAVLLAAPNIVRAQDTVTLGTLTPLTGAGGPYGPSMRDAVAGVIKAVNAAGGVAGKQINLVSEDSQTNPDASVRAAKKLIDVDKVSAIIGTWASADTTAVAPSCWESKTCLFTVSGSDTITELPHQGFIFRTQPNSKLQLRVASQFMLDDGAQHLAYIGVQAPFAQSSIDIMTEAATKAGKKMSSLIYENNKTSYRSEVDQILSDNPDWMMLGGYTPDTTVLLRDIYKAGYQGKMIGFAYAVNAKLVEALPKEVTEGVYTFQPTPAVGSQAYDDLVKMVGHGDIDPYTAQTFDHINLAVLAMAKANGTTGQDIHDHVRDISQGGGTAVYGAIDGMKALAAGDKIDYSGASGPCDFLPSGDISGTKFRFDQVKDGKFVTVKTT